MDIVQGFPTPPPPNAYKILVGKSERKRSVGDLDADGRRAAFTAIRIVVGTSGGNDVVVSRSENGGEFID